jgi:hypothetical protein
MWIAYAYEEFSGQTQAGPIRKHQGGHRGEAEKLLEA